MIVYTYSAGVVGFEVDYGGPYRFVGFCAQTYPLFTKVVFACFDRSSCNFHPKTT